MVRSYAETRDCRRRLLLGYFGQTAGSACGACDNCDERGDEVPAVAKTSFPAGSRVRHRTLGDGTVMEADADRLVVLFEEHGYTTLSVPLLEEGNLLRTAR
jgi:ATP-dependent DNA helicase RecQ